MMAEKSLPTFGQWLSRMQQNASSIGDLARALSNDPAWSRLGDNRGAYLGYLIESGAPAPRIAAFNHAWANYQTAIKRAQGQQAPRIAGSPGQGEPPAQDAQESAQGQQGEQESAGSIVHVVTVPVDSPCEECGETVDSRQWTIPGIGQGVLCRKCFDDVLEQIVTALGGQMGV